MRLLTYIIGISIPLFALFIGIEISPYLGNILITPIEYLSTLLGQNFSQLPYLLHASLTFSMVIFFILILFFSSRFFMKKILD